MTRRIYKVKERFARAYTHVPSGQRVSTWLPAGLWRVIGECQIINEDGNYVDALILRRPIPMRQEGEWYASPMWFSPLRQQ